MAAMAAMAAAMTVPWQGLGPLANWDVNQDDQNTESTRIWETDAKHRT